MLHLHISSHNKPLKPVNCSLNILKEFDCITKLNLIQNVDCNASKYLYLKHGFRNTKQLPELLILGDCFFSPSTGAEILSQSAKKVLNFLEMSTNNVSNKAELNTRGGGSVYRKRVPRQSFAKICLKKN